MRKFSDFELLAALAALLYFAKRKPSGAVQGWKGGKPIDVVLVQVDDAGHLLAQRAATQFAAMRAAAAHERVDLIVNSAFRTMEEQTQFWVEYMRGERTAVVAAPGYSNHQAGTALDIESDGGTNAAFRWLTANAARFGFHRTVASEPWHWEYV